MLQALCGIHGNVGTADWIVQAGFQVLYLLATLVPIRWCPHDQHEDQRIDGTATCLEACGTGIPDAA